MFWSLSLFFKFFDINYMCFVMGVIIEEFDI